MVVLKATQQHTIGAQFHTYVPGLISPADQVFWLKKKKKKKSMKKNLTRL